MSQRDARPGADSQPILLFDGVCNLCDAAVQFVIDRDRKQQFRFAALQSAGAPDDLPDSMVVLDERGVHTRSDAAIAVARRLSFPWVLLALAHFIPRFVRDPLYAWVARNRYRWFGRQRACRVPTPEPRARFLDADEPARPQHMGDDDSEAPAPPAASLGLGTLPERFVLIYPIVFMLPFPLTLLALTDHIPGVSGSMFATARDWVIGLHQ